MSLVSNLVCSFVGTIAFSIVFNVPKKYYPWCGFTGMLGWFIFLMLENHFSATAGTFAASITVVLMARIFAVWQKCPITLFLVPGIFPLIPGAGVYNTAYYLVTEQLQEAAYKGIESIKIAFAIVLGIVFIFSIPREVFIISGKLIKSKKKENNNDEN